MTLSNTPLVTRLQERYCNHAWRLRASSRLLWLWLSGRVGRRALGCAPPARAGQGKTPQDRFVFIEQNDLPAASLVLKGGKFKRTISEVSGGGS